MRGKERDKLRPIAEELITALEIEDHELKADAVVVVFSRFELKKVEEPVPAWQRVGLLAYLFRDKKVGVEPRSEHPKHPRHPHRRP